MKLLRRVGELLGVGGDRSAQLPRYVALADGLLVTDTHAEAWYVMDSSNTDLMSESARDAELDAATRAMSRILAGYDCHLKIVWTPFNAESYLTEAPGLFEAGHWQEWAELRVQRLADLALPTRHLLLGVRIASRSGVTSTAGRGVQGAFGLDAHSLPRRELARLDAKARQLGRQLESTPWKARPATVEMLAWTLGREQQRDIALPAPDRAGVISGAKLAALTRGRVVPYPDHLRIYDSHGQVTAWTSILTMTGFPEQLESPGAGEWLRTLAEISYIPSEDDIAGDEDSDYGDLILTANPEASVRFRVLPSQEGLRKVTEQRRLAKEQRLSAAKHSAGETSEEIQETELRMSSLARDMLRDAVTLVEDHPRIVVSSQTSLDDLRAQIDAVIAHYGGLGIDVNVAAEEQRELWLESQPGDQLRVADLGHTRTVQALAGSWWWGGAQVGDDTGPICGYLTGSTQGPVRNDITAGSDRGDATTTAFIGRSGRGKSTALMLSALDAAFRNACVIALDFKGDLGGLVSAGQRFGLNAHLIETGARFAGATDLFALLDRDGSERAQIEVPAQLGIAIPPHLRARGAETPIQQAVNEVIQMGDPATWRVIEHLKTMPDELAQETGRALDELARTPLGAPFMGRPTGVNPLTPEPGLWVFQIPGLSLPGTTDVREDWSVLQRMSVALMHSMLAYGITIAGRKDLRTLRKVVAVPEVHVLTATREGSSFLDYVARVGRALRTSLMLDTQDPASMNKLVGVVEQLTTVVGFQLTSVHQQDALAELLGLPPGAHTRALIEAVGMTADREIRHGHCIMRDRRFHAATMQWDIPSVELLQLLDTSPTAQHGQEPDSPHDGVRLDKTPEEASA